MNLLAIDTCDARGSVALLRDEQLVAQEAHTTQEEYSSWLLLAVERVLGASGLQIGSLDVYAVASGPGSFTGLRVGLTTVKAWAEVYGRPVAAVSRLAAVADLASSRADLVAPFLDAQREQVFGGLFKRTAEGLVAVGEEMVSTPGAFLEWIAEHAAGRKVAWVSPDGERISSDGAWAARQNAGEEVEAVSPVLAGVIGRIGFRKIQRGDVTDALKLDANYVRRSDAEIFWKRR